MADVYFDGASKGNPGLSGAGVFINHHGEIITYSLPLEKMDNHLAEWHALIKALEICLENHIDHAFFKTDSKVVCNSIEKKFVKNPQFKPLLQQALTMIDKIPLFFINWIPESKNKADSLAKKAIHL